MAPFLAVDFGTSSTKSALVDLDSGVLRHLRRRPALPAATDRPGRHEVSLAAIRGRFDAICRDAWSASPFAGIVLCSEMHGFAVLRADTGAPLTPYISWLDARALEAVDGSTTFARLRAALGDDAFRRLSGMRARPGFPLMNLAHCGRTLDLPEQVAVVSLPGWLAMGDDGRIPVEHPTILAGMAVYDVGARRNAPELLDVVRQVGGLRAIVGDPAPEGTVAGHWPGPEGQVPVYVGVGDHQCSVLGAGVTGPGAASVNLGTGSQVCLVGGPDDPARFERRPFFDGTDLAAVTHIPAGRALDQFVSFLEAVAAFGTTAGRGAAPDFWQALAGLTAAEVEAATLDVDLAVFEGARGFAGGGRIGAIVEGALTPHGYLAGVLRAFARQYVEVLDAFDPGHALERVALGGGIARNLPHLPQILARASGRRVDAAAGLDESLLGLRALALRCAGRATSTAAAQRVHGRACEVADG